MENVVNTLQNCSFFGLALTLAAFFAGRWVSKKTGIRALNPMVISMFIIIGCLLLLPIDYETYNSSAKLLTTLLGPTTVALAIPAYRQIRVLKRNWWLILISVACGAVSCMIFILGFSILTHIDPTIFRSILTKSITTAIAQGITTEFGGYVELTIFAVTITGVSGATFGIITCRLFGIRDRVAVGLSMGTSCHAIGTSCALAVGDVEGAMSSLALVTAGLISVVVAPYIGYLL